MFWEGHLASGQLKMATKERKRGSGDQAEMMTFRKGRLADLALPAKTVRLMVEIAESKGRQQLYARQAPQLLRALRAAAFVRGVQFSTRIDGVTVAPDRLLSLVWGHIKPRNQSEKEIRGYVRALTLIYASASEVQVTPDFLRRLHETILEGAVGAGQWRTNESTGDEFVGENSLAFSLPEVPVPEIPAAVEELCTSYREVLHDRRVPSLLAVAALVFDFQCLYPFRRGHTRMSHLLALLGLYHHGFEIGRSISLERCFEQSRQDCSNALRLSSAGWQGGLHDLNPWLEYFFTVLRRAYQEFEQRAGEAASPRGAKTVLVETAVDGFPSAFTFSELERTCPGVSRVVVYRVLRQLRRKGVVERVNRGSQATWRRILENLS
jgi:Fic family protein